MLDKKTHGVLRTLGKLSEDCAYKVITIEEILSTLPSKTYDADSVKETIDFLCKQEYIVIKFEEDYTLCYSLLPKARIYLETETGKNKPQKTKLPFLWGLLIGLSSGIISSVLNFLFYYIFRNFL